MSRRNKWKDMNNVIAFLARIWKQTHLAKSVTTIMRVFGNEMKKMSYKKARRGMTREELIQNLKYIMKKHEHDKVYTFYTNISLMCKDILDYLEQEPRKTLSRIEYGTDGNLYELSISGGTNKVVEQEPCEDAISRSDMLDAIEHGMTYTSEDLQRIIKALLPVNPQPKIGKWTNADPICPCCDENKFKDLDADVWADWKPKFCPNCGAKMESEGKG